ncbi:MAG: hypothetical protein GY757_25980, partial [bacterium]|nr:hypothetical protein [bacterium]
TMKIATHHQSHYEAFLLHELKGAETETRQIEMATRAIHLYEQQGGDAPQTAAKVLDTMKNAIKAMKKEFSLLTALSDYLVCPKCKEKESPDVPYPGSKIYRAFYRGGLSHRRLWGIIERTDMFCSRLRLLLSLLSTLEGTESYYLERALKKNYHQIKKRLVKYYKLFRHEISTAPGLDETVKEFLTALTDFRLELLEKNRDDAQTDSWILKRRIQVTGTPMKNTLKDTKRNA